MTRQEQNEIIINAISDKLKDLPNVQQIISAKFDEWFRSLVASGAEAIQPKQASGDAAAGDGGGGDTEAAPPPPEQGAA